MNANSKQLDTHVSHPSFRSFWFRWLIFFLVIPIVTQLRIEMPEMNFYIPDIIGDGLGDIPITSFAVVPLAVLFNILWFHWNTKYVVGPNSVQVISGIFGITRKTVIAEYSKLLGATVEQGPAGQLLRYGDVKMGTAETSESELSFKGITNPEDFVRLIKSRMDLHRGNVVVEAAPLRKIS